MSVQSWVDHLGGRITTAKIAGHRPTTLGRNQNQNKFAEIVSTESSSTLWIVAEDTAFRSDLDATLNSLCVEAFLLPWIPIVHVAMHCNALAKQYHMLPGRSNLCRVAARQRLTASTSSTMYYQYILIHNTHLRGRLTASAPITLPGGAPGWGDRLNRFRSVVPHTRWSTVQRSHIMCSLCKGVQMFTF